MTDGQSQADSTQQQTQTSQQNASQAGNGASSSDQGSSTNVDMAKIFGDDFVKDPALKDFKDPQSFVKAFKDTKAAIGRPRYDVPGQDAPPEVLGEFYKKMGVPEKADDYGLKPDANVPEHNNETNAAFLKAFSDRAFELKMTASQAQGMQKFMDEIAVNVAKAEAARQAEEDAQLTSLLSKALGGEDINIAANRIKSEIEKVLPPEMRDLLQNKVSNEALTAIAILESHFRKTYGASDKNIGDTGGSSSKSIADLQKEGRDLMSSKEYRDPMHPNHKDAVQKADSIYKTITQMQGNKK